MSQWTTRAHAILAAEAAAIAAVTLDPSFDEAIETLFNCCGKIVTTGMGKAGLVARKFGATLCSTGSPATYLHPGEAVHGDLGVISPKDCIVAFSTSGKTREVLDAIQLARHLDCGPIIAITSHPESELRRLSDKVIDMGIVKEPCPLEVTPTASVAVMSAIGDAIALILMERRGFSLQDYGLRHHAGYLGAKAREGNGGRLLAGC
ncbi:SIS domain-containing protein [Trinickia mobilis]|uniref:SIS domain-containing protein n=1 Tax=Trinickia mobilis TaxID=2816356 RepID=UPI001A8D1D31|nr:SIS domain-containing protein [Trinickia mobilis]